MNLPDKKRGPDFRAFLRRLDTFGREVRHSELPFHSTALSLTVALRANRTRSATAIDGRQSWAASPASPPSGHPAGFRY